MKTFLFKFLILFITISNLKTVSYGWFEKDTSSYYRATLVIKSNSDCQLTIDSRKVIKIVQGELVKVNLSAGKHWLVAHCELKEEAWKKEMILEDFSETIVEIEFSEMIDFINKNKENIKLGTFTDPRDGTTYKVRRVGRKTWMVQNLAFDAEKGCWVYDFDKHNLEKYGRLYNWKTAKSVCPTGWRLPNKDDFEQLLDDLEFEKAELYDALKIGGDSGYEANCAGWRFSGDFFNDLGEIGSYWSSTSNGPEEAWLLYFLDKKRSVEVSTYSKECGFSVRCVWDNR